MQKWLTIKACLFNDVQNVLVFTVQNDGQSFCMAKPMVFHTFGRFVGQCLKPGNLLLRQFHSDRVFGELKNLKKPLHAKPTCANKNEICSQSCAVKRTTIHGKTNAEPQQVEGSLQL